MEVTRKYDVYSLDEDFRGETPKLNDNIRFVCPEHGVFTSKWYLAIKGYCRCPVCFPDVKVYEYGTKGYCMQDALRYKTRSEWRRKSGTAYHYALKNKWLEECCSHMVEGYKPKGHWTKEKCKENALGYKTRSEWKNKSSAYQIALKNKWVDECCVHMVETQKSHGFWTKEKCMEDALKYNMKSEWKSGSSAAYSATVRNKWLGECCTHMVETRKPDGYWSKERCMEDALKYNMKSEWEKKAKAAYQAAVKNKWIDECCKHMIVIQRPAGYWTKEKCMEDALNYSTRGEWGGNSSAYQIAVKNKWLGECCGHMIYIQKPHGFWTKDKCIEDALNYNTRKEWCEAPNAAYQTALNNKWIDECCSHMEFSVRVPHGYWTKEKCMEDALKYNTRNEWQKNSGAYNKALANKWIDECCHHMTQLQKPHGFWTKEKCKQDALKYKTRTEWQKKLTSAYATAQRNKWVDECCLHMVETRKPAGYWTKEKCKEDALKYVTRTEWQIKSMSAYQAARKNKWFDECCSHMVELHRPHGYWTKEKCMKDALVYTTRNEWNTQSASAYATAQRNKWMEECCVHMVSGRPKPKPLPGKQYIPNQPNPA